MWDYIVIGAGSAGCALARALSTSGGKSVLVLEAGGSDRSLYIKLPAGVLRACTTYDWGYKAQPDPTRDGIIEYWLRGKVLGGSSSINGTIFVRGAAHDFDRWSALCGNTGHWSAEELMPIFKDIETSNHLSPCRGTSGPLQVRTVKRPHPITQAFIRSAGAAGYPFNEDYNGRSQEGVGYTQFSQRRGWRCSSADAFLKPLLRQRSNITLNLNALVEKIELTKGRATGVVFSHRGKRVRAGAQDVILCAGAINSPQLLMLSGIGDANELRRHGIDVAVDLPSVGRNLRDHPLVRMTYRIKTPTNNPTEGLWQKLRIAAEFALKGEGPISNLFEGMAFVKSSAARATPDLQLFFLTVGYVKTPHTGWQLAPYPAVMVYAAYSYPQSAGCVRLASADPAAPPVIEYPLFADQSDADAMSLGVHTIRRIMGAEPIASLVEEEVFPGPAATTRSEIESFVRANVNICYHSIGTCRMGANSDSVVTPELNVRGAENLWIADASVMPDPISANTNAACMMIGAKLGKQLSDRR